MNLHLQLTWSTHLAYITALHKQRLQFCFLVSISLFHWGLNGWMWCQQHSNWKLSISWGLKAAERVPQVMIKQYCSKTQWQMFLLVSSCHVGAPHEGYQHGVSIQSSINLGKTFLSHGFWYFAWSRTREIQVFPRNPAKFPKKREIPRNPPEIFPNTCRQNIFNTYLGF